MAEIDGFGNRRLHVHSGIPEVRVVRSRGAVAARSGLSAKQYRRGARSTFDRRVQAVSGVCTRFAARSRTQVLTAVSLGYLRPEESEQLLQLSAEVGRILHGLLSALPHSLDRGASRSQTSNA